MSSTSDKPLGQRQRNKRDKLQRIKNAAQQLFISKGFDDTTTREIAVEAGVGMGTVFTYADNKRDLLFLIANDDLEEAVRRASISSSQSLMDNLLAVFGSHYEYFSLQPALSRLMLREMLFYDSGQNANRFKTTRENVMELIAQCVELAKTDSTIDTKHDPKQIAWVLFCIYQVELRRWLASRNRDLAVGLKNLKAALTIALTGVAPGRVALKTSAGRK